MLPKIALATSRDYPRLDDDDRFLPPAFRAAGFQAEPVIWDDAGIDWKGFQSVILRNVWDYHEKLEPFRAWLDRLRQSGVIVWNPVAAVLGNLHKTYLRDLERRGT